GKKGSFEVRAIVATAGYDPLLLSFPGQSLEVQRPGQVPARWMTEAAAIAKPAEAVIQSPSESNAGTHRQPQILSQQEVMDLFR
ncbi:TPA: hypothetical protein ACG3DH_001375, partial [Stenotrophomonas maltophilia]